MLIDVQLPPISGDEVGRYEVVAGQPTGAHEMADAPAQREASHPGVRKRAAWRGEPVGDRRRINVEPERSTLYACGPRSGIDCHLAHQPEVDGDRVIGHGVTRDTVATPAHSISG